MQPTSRITALSLQMLSSLVLLSLVSSTDAETRAAFRGVRRVITLRPFFMHLGYPISSPTPLFEDNKGMHMT